MGSVRIGTCGFSQRQHDYFRRFSTIEIQKTFYQPPQRSTAERWRDDAPDDFEFTLKAFQAITHDGSSPTYRRSKLTGEQRSQCGSFRDTELVRAAWETTLDIAQALRASFVIFQCPASFEPCDKNVSNLRKFFSRAERDGLHLGFEPRGELWTRRLVHDLCRDLDLVHVVDPLETKPAYGTPRYFRLHGHGEVAEPSGYRHRYSDRELKHLRGQCTARLTYCFFNNVAMNEDAERFQTLTG